MKRNLLFLGAAFVFMGIVPPSFGAEGLWTDVKSFGADNTGAKSSLPAFNAAIASLPPTGGIIVVPPGTYDIGSGFRVIKRGVKIVGAGGYATTLNFVPTANNQIAVDFRMDPDTQMLADVGIGNLRISSVDTEHSGKIAVRLYDVGESKFENLWIWGWHSTDFTAEAIRTQGREMVTFDGLKVWADLPIHVAKQVNAGGVDIDHFVFRDTYMLALDKSQTRGTGRPHVLLDDGVVLQNVVWEGTNSWVGGKHGLYWGGGNPGGTSLNLSMKNIRWEQNRDPDGWFVYIDHYLQNALFENLSGGAAGNGFYFRKVYQPTLVNISYGMTKVGLDADDSVRNLRLVNAMFQAGSTAKLNNLVELSAQGFEGTTIPTNAMYGRTDKYFNRSNGVYRMSYNTGPLGNGASYAIPFFTSVSPEDAIITVTAKGPSNEHVGGTVSMVTGSVSLLGSTAGFGVGGGPGLLSVKYASPTRVTLENRLGYPVSALITVEGKQ